MQALISFDRNFCEDWHGPLWILRTPENEVWFNRQGKLLAGSALFLCISGEPPVETLLRVLWNVQDHHPSSTSVQVRGFPLDPSVLATLRKEGLEPTSVWASENRFFLDMAPQN